MFPHLSKHTEGRSREVFSMKDLLLIPIMLAEFAFGYFVVVRADAFLEGNRRLFFRSINR